MLATEVVAIGTWRCRQATGERPSRIRNGAEAGHGRRPLQWHIFRNEALGESHSVRMTPSLKRRRPKAAELYFDDLRETKRCQIFVHWSKDLYPDWKPFD
jgi:hypothetical protein